MDLFEGFLDHQALGFQLRIKELLEPLCTAILLSIHHVVRKAITEDQSNVFDDRLVTGVEHVIQPVSDGRWCQGLWGAGHNGDNLEQLPC